MWISSLLIFRTVITSINPSGSSWNKNKTKEKRSSPNRAGQGPFYFGFVRIETQPGWPRPTLYVPRVNRTRQNQIQNQFVFRMSQRAETIKARQHGKHEETKIETLSSKLYTLRPIPSNSTEILRGIS